VALAYMTDMPLQSRIIAAVADQMVHACSGRSMQCSRRDCGTVHRWQAELSWLPFLTWSITQGDSDVQPCHSRSSAMPSPCMSCIKPLMIYLPFPASAIDCLQLSCDGNVQQDPIMMGMPGMMLMMPAGQQGMMTPAGKGIMVSL